MEYSAESAYVKDCSLYTAVYSSNDFMNFFTYKIDNIRDKIITMQPSTTVSPQTVHCSLLEEKFDSFIAIGEEEFTKLVKSSKSTTCMLDPIPGIGNSGPGGPLSCRV